MSIVPSIRSGPAAAPALLEPLTVEAALSLDDWTDALLHMHRAALARRRRRVLIVLGLVWFLTLLGIVANLATEGNVKGTASFLREVSALPLIPVGVFLAIATLGMTVSYAALPWWARRAVRTLLRDDMPQPATLRYRFDENGIGVTDAHQSVLVPWSWIVRLDETEGQLLPTTDGVDDLIVLPKRALDEGTADRVRDWIAERAGEAGPPPERSAGEDPKAKLTLTYAPTLQDRIAVIVRQQELPWARRRRLNGFALVFVGFSLIWPLLFAFGWIVDPHRVPFEFAFPLYLDMFADLFWIPAAVFGLLLALLMLVHKRFRMAAAHIAAIDLQKRARPGEVHMTIGEDGIRTRKEGSRGDFGWGAFRGIERTDSHVFLPLSRGSVLPLPRRAFDAAWLAEFEALAGRHITDRRGAPT